MRRIYSCRESISHIFVLRTYQFRTRVAIFFLINSRIVICFIQVLFYKHRSIQRMNQLLDIGICYSLAVQNWFYVWVIVFFSIPDTLFNSNSFSLSISEYHFSPLSFLCFTILMNRPITACIKETAKGSRKITN